ncbi:MAG: tetratricopeptide repeat protein [Syntrophobacterales bacterium]|nr:tetratricopeptide repeat protein [Syntrophobacterales bacterium]
MQSNGPEEQTNFHRQARSYLEEGRYNQSLNLAKERLLEDPEDIRAAIVLCRSWLGLGKIEEAVAAFAEIEPLNRELARLLKLLGDAYRGRGNSRKAVNFYQRSLALLPDIAELQEVQNAIADLLDEDGGDGGENIAGDGFQTITMADLHLRQGHYEAAREILTAILLRDPDQAEARQRLDELVKLQEQKNSDLPIDKKTTVVHELSRWLMKLGEEKHEG